MTDRPLRVALVLGTSTGGIGQHVRSLAAGLVARGHRVLVLGPADTESVFGFSAVGARFHPVEIAAGIHPRDAVAVARLRRLTREADVVHAHGLRAGFLALAARAGGRRRPLVVTWHNQVLAQGARKRLFHAIERVVARGADVTLGASSDLVARARELGASDARPGPVAAPPLGSSSRTRAQVRASLGLDDDRPLVLAVGRLHPQKGYPTLLAAAARWAGRTPPPSVCIAGDGPQEAQLRDRIDRDGLPVRLLGRRSDVADLLTAADVVVLPSLWEARALVAQEALRAGVPLVASEVGGIPELVGDAALLVPVSDPVALADAVDRVLDDRGLAESLARAGSARAAGWPDEAAVVTAVEAVYRGVVDRRVVDRGDTR